VEGDSGAVATQWSTRASLELDYGVTDSLDAGYQLDLASSDFGSIRYAGSQFRLHGSLFDKAELPVDLGWVAELEWIRSPQYSENQLELDLHPVVERDFGRFTVDLNPTFEEGLVGSTQWQSIQFSYAAKVVYRWMRQVSPGIDFYEISAKSQTRSGLVLNSITSCRRSMCACPIAFASIWASASA
jgi:hypothetical protein